MCRPSAAQLSPDSEPLELELKTKLNLALRVWRICLRDIRAAGEVYIASTATAAARSKVRKTKAWMVEDVEKLRPEFQLVSLAQLKIFINREVEVYKVGTAQHCAFRVSEHVSGGLPGSESGNRKCGLVEPAIESLVAGFAAAERQLSSYIKGKVVGVRNPVGACAGSAGVGDIAAE